MPVNVKTAARRELHFNSLDDLLADAESTTAHGTRTPATTGNWSAPQIIQHIATSLHLGNHGAGFSVSLPVRMFGRVLKLLGVHTKPMKPGIKPPAKIAAAFAPAADITIAAAMQHLREEVAYAKEHGITHPSALFGKMTPDEAVQMNCRHAEMHFGFIQP